MAFAGIRAAGLGSWDSIGCVRLPNRAASTAFRKANAETISFRDGFGQSLDRAATGGLRQAGEEMLRPVQTERFGRVVRLAGAGDRRIRDLDPTAVHDLR